MINYFKNNAFSKNILILFSGAILINILNYAFHFIIARLVSIEVYGEAESLISLINIISVPTIALTIVMTQYGAMHKAHNDRQKSYEAINYFNKKVLIYGLPIFLIVMVLMPHISKFLNMDTNIPLLLIWILMFLTFFICINIGILNGWQRFMDTNVAGILGTVTKLLFGVILVKIGFAINGVIGGFLIGGIVTYLASIFMIKFIVKDFKKVKSNEKTIDFEPIKGYIVPVFIGSLAISNLGNMDVILAKHNLIPLLAGQYGALAVASKAIFFINGIIAGLLFPMSAENKHKGISSMNILKNAILFTFFISIFATLAYFLFPKTILSLLLGEKYLAVASYLGWFAIIASIFSFSNLILQYLLSIHETKVVYFFLAVSILGSIMILLIGKSIMNILLIMLFTNIFFFLAGMLFLIKKNLLNFKHL